MSLTLDQHVRVGQLQRAISEVCQDLTLVILRGQLTAVNAAVLAAKLDQGLSLAEAVDRASTEGNAMPVEGFPTLLVADNYR